MRYSYCLPAWLWMLAAPCMGTAFADDSAAMKAMFAHPPREFASAPLWVWNDLLTEDEVIATMRDLAGQGVRQVFVHPRPGLMTAYLSPDWFRLWKACIAEAERLDMNVWIYDENSYPSGFAGGFVPEAMPESRGHGAHLKEAKRIEKLDDNALAAYKLDGGACENITERARKGESFPEGSYLVALIEESKPSPWFAGKYYVDLLYPGVTEKFLDITLGAYHRELGGALGTRVPGSFTDEPHLAPAGGLHWTADFAGVFGTRWGYSLVDTLPGLFQETGDWKRVRHNYFQVLSDLFVERWAKPYSEYCERLGIEFTGHYWEHSWPDCVSVPDNMAMYMWHQRPSIDILFNQYNEGVHAQFGNVRSVIELASVANQMGRKRTLCETYGGSGWDMRFEDFKRLGDWVCVLGVNTIDEHLSHITIRGARKRDYPPTFSYHEPWWDAYHVLESYFTRLMMALSRGEQMNTILVLEPTTTVWMYQTTGRDRADAIGETFQQLVVSLAKAQVEFDLGSENIMAQHGSVDGKALVVGHRRYDTVVLPASMENLNAKTCELLEAFAKAGGAIVSVDALPPALIDGQPSERGQTLAKSPVWSHVESSDLAPFLKGRQGQGFAIVRAQEDKGTLYHMRRKLDDGDLVFLSNTSNDAPTAGQIASDAHGVQQWDCATGEIAPYSFASDKDGVAVSFNLPPCGSLLLFFSKQSCESVTAAASPSVRVEPAGPMDARRCDPNVLTLDYMDVSAGGETKTDLHFHRANTFAFQKNGMSANPWDHAVQFGDEFMRKTFPADSGLEAAYKFTIKGAVPSSLYFVIERADLYTVTCNGKPVSAPEGQWWLDRSFGKIDITAAAKAGENEVRLKASPFSVFHELECAYVLGEFALQPAAKGFAIVPAQPLKAGAWNEQGCPLYGHHVAYTQAFNVAQPKGRYVVALPSWYGSVAKVLVNGSEAGYIFHQPFECDVTKLLVPGENRVEVVVCGTLKNTMGPHHGNQPLGFASPGSFHKGAETGPPPGAEYDSVKYGLFAPFELRAES